MFADMWALLDVIRARPAMYLGNLHAHSFAVLQATMFGASAGRLPAGEPPFWGIFRWVLHRERISQSTNVTEWMEQSWGNDEAWERFFAYVDEYRKCRVVELETVLLPKRPPPKKYFAEWPEKLVVCQYYPTPVFFLREIGPGERDTESLPYFDTLAEAKAHAQRYYLAPKSGWTTIVRC